MATLKLNPGANRPDDKAGTAREVAAKVLSLILFLVGPGHERRMGLWVEGDH